MVGSRYGVDRKGSGSSLRGSGRQLGVVVLLVLLSVAPLSGCSKSSNATKATGKSNAQTATNSSDSEKSGKDGQSEADNSVGDKNESGETAGSDGGTSSSSKGNTSGPRGNINKVEPSRPDPGSLAPVDIAETAKFNTGVTVRVSAMEPTEAKAVLPGEIAGPAVLIKVELSNGSSKPIDLDGVAVTMTGTSGAPVISHIDPRAVPFSGTADPGSTASGSYLFRIDPDQRESVTLSVKYSSETPTAIITGSLPNG